MRSARAVVVLVAALVATACASGGGKPAADPVAQARAVDAELQGSWRLVDWRPDVSLEPMLQAWLDAQKQVLVVRFEQSRLRADSPTLKLDRPYTISNVSGRHFTLSAPGNSGVVYTSTAEITPDGQRVLFHGETQPFRGTGLLERAR